MPEDGAPEDDDRADPHDASEGEEAGFLIEPEGVAAAADAGEVPVSGDALPRQDSSGRLDYKAQEDPLTLDFTPSIFVAGMLHVINNCTEDLAGTLLWWSELVNMLRHLCRSLSRRWSFLATILTSGLALTHINPHRSQDEKKQRS